jgi:hypothetical protein
MKDLRGQARVTAFLRKSLAQGAHAEETEKWGTAETCAVAWE